MELNGGSPEKFFALNVKRYCCFNLEMGYLITVVDFISLYEVEFERSPRLDTQPTNRQCVTNSQQETAYLQENIIFNNYCHIHY